MEDLSHALMSERQWRSEIIKFMHELRKVTDGPAGAASRASSTPLRIAARESIGAPL